MSSTELRNFLELSYAELEDLNLAAKAQRLDRVSADKIAEERMKYLTDEKRIKAVTVCFTDLEGRLHMLDYDKKFLLKSADNLTFDGSSVRGFTAQRESDLRLAIDWHAFYWLPADIFTPGKVLVFGDVLQRDGKPYPADMRAILKGYSSRLWEQDGTQFSVANEIEGFAFKGLDAERRFYETGEFEFVSTGGYYYSLPGDPLRTFIDTAAEVQRAMGFSNEKDHPEVAPAQFEMNYAHTEASIAADQVQLYKLIARQVASRLGMSASFLPKPVTGVNGNGMHTNISISRQGNNQFWDANGQEQISAFAWEFIDRILTSGEEICLVFNSSVNSYRRLDPHFEAPNQIKVSPIDRGSMIRIPLGNEKSSRVEIRSVAPDANPYMTLFTMMKVGLEGPIAENVVEMRDQKRYLSDNIYDAIAKFSKSEFLKNALGCEVAEKFAELKLASAERCPKALGTRIKRSEIMFHHEVQNQYLWSQF